MDPDRHPRSPARVKDHHRRRASRRQPAGSRLTMRPPENRCRIRNPVPRAETRHVDPARPHHRPRGHCDVSATHPGRAARPARRWFHRPDQGRLRIHHLRETQNGQTLKPWPVQARWPSQEVCGAEAGSAGRAKSLHARTLCYPRRKAALQRFDPLPGQPAVCTSDLRIHGRRR